MADLKQKLAKVENAIEGLDRAAEAAEERKAEIEESMEVKVSEAKDKSRELEAMTGHGFSDDHYEAIRKTAEAKRQGVDAELVSDLEAGRERIAELLEETEGELEAWYHNATTELGLKGDQWAEAESRATFIREDLEGLSPDEIITRYKRAEAAGDAVDTWLLARYGRDQLEQYAAEGQTRRARDARRVLVELEDTRAGEIEATYKERRAELRHLAVEAKQPRGAIETERERKKVYARHGVRSFD